jgi:mercuric ion transport protein
MRSEPLAAGGAVIAAVGATLCCTGPTLAAVLGLGAFAAAGFFETIRPALVAVVGLLLAYGFYTAYLRKDPAGAPGEACALGTSGRTNKLLFWATLATVIALGFLTYLNGARAFAATGATQRALGRAATST